MKQFFLLTIALAGGFLATNAMRFFGYDAAKESRASAATKREFPYQSYSYAYKKDASGLSELSKYLARKDVSNFAKILEGRKKKDAMEAGKDAVKDGTTTEASAAEFPYRSYSYAYKDVKDTYKEIKEDAAKDAMSKDENAIPEYAKLLVGGKDAGNAVDLAQSDSKQDASEMTVEEKSLDARDEAKEREDEKKNVDSSADSNMPEYAKLLISGRKDAAVDMNAKDAEVKRGLRKLWFRMSRADMNEKDTEGDEARPRRYGYHSKQGKRDEEKDVAANTLGMTKDGPPNTRGRGYFYRGTGADAKIESSVDGNVAARPSPWADAKETDRPFMHPAASAIMDATSEKTPQWLLKDADKDADDKVSAAGVGWTGRPWNKDVANSDTAGNEDKRPMWLKDSKGGNKSPYWVKDSKGGNKSPYWAKDSKGANKSPYWMKDSKGGNKRPYWMKDSRKEEETNVKDEETTKDQGESAFYYRGDEVVSDDASITQPMMWGKDEAQPHMWGKDEAQPHMWGKDEAQPHMWGKDEAQPHMWGKDEAQPHMWGKDEAQHFFGKDEAQHFFGKDESQPHMWGKDASASVGKREASNTIEEAGPGNARRWPGGDAPMMNDDDDALINVLKDEIMGEEKRSRSSRMRRRHRRLHGRRGYKDTSENDSTEAKMV